MTKIEKNRFQTYSEVLLTIKNSVYHQKTSIDSFRIKTPLPFVKWINPIINQKKYIISEDVFCDGDIEKMIENTSPEDFIEWKGKKTYQHICEGGNTTSYLLYQNNKTKHPYLIIMGSSKILGKNYLDGINLFNIELLYKKLIDQGLFKIDIDDFLFYSYINDYDLKIDIKLEEDKRKAFYQKSRDDINNNLKSQGIIGEICKKYKGGFSCGHRHSTPSKLPLFKAYSKNLELKSRYPEFMSQYLLDDLTEIKELVRLEVTLTKTTHLNKRFRDIYTQRKNDLGINHELISNEKHSDTVAEALIFNHLIGNDYLSYVLDKWFGEFYSSERFIEIPDLSINTQILVNLFQRHKEMKKQMLLYKNYYNTGTFRDVELPKVDEPLLNEITDFIKTRQSKSRKRIEIKKALEHGASVTQNEFEQEVTARTLIHQLLERGHFYRSKEK